SVDAHRAGARHAHREPRAARARAALGFELVTVELVPPCVVELALEVRLELEEELRRPESRQLEATARIGHCNDAVPQSVAEVRRGEHEDSCPGTAVGAQELAPVGESAEVELEHGV